MMGRTSYQEHSVQQQEGISMTHYQKLTDESAHFCEGTPAPLRLPSGWWRC